MKSASNPLRAWSVSALLFAAVLPCFWSCKAKYPTSALPQADALASTGVLNFDGAGAAVTTVNATLAEADMPGNVIQRSGAVQFTGGGAAWSLVSPGAEGSARALRVSGAVTEVRLQLWIPLDTLSPTGYYNASLFSGIRFYLKVASADNTSPKYFSLPTSQTMPAPQGTCLTKCYDHFGATYSSTGGQWTLVSLDFSSLTQGGWGTKAVPSTFSGDNLKQVVQLQWQEDNPNFGLSGPVTSSNADFQIDQIQFY
jgi:hypothetical protein